MQIQLNVKALRLADLHLRWLTVACVAVLKISELRNSGRFCVLSKNKFKAQKSNKLRWLAADINFKLKTATQLVSYRS